MLEEEWDIVYWTGKDEFSPIELWLDDLSQEKLKSISKDLLLLKKVGNRMRMPHSKSLGNGLFELREMRFGLRIYYSFNKNKIVILLTAGDKSSQKRDIKIAQERLSKIKK